VAASLRRELLSSTSDLHWRKGILFLLLGNKAITAAHGKESDATTAQER